MPQDNRQTTTRGWGATARGAAPIGRRGPGPALAAALLLAAAGAPPARAFTGFSLLTPERLWDFARLDDPQVSPDGRHVVFTVTAFPRDSDLPSIDLWLAAADGDGKPRQLTRNPGPDIDPAWSPDGQQLAYASRRPGERSMDIHLLDLRGGEPVPVARMPTDARRPRFRGDGETLVFEAGTFPDVNDDREALAARIAATEERQAAAAASEARIARRNGRPVDDRLVTHLFEVPVTGGDPVDLLAGFERTGPITEFSWDLSPDGTAIAFTALVDDPPWLRRDLDVYLLLDRAGRPVNLTADLPGSAFAPRFDTRGGVLYGHRPTPDTLAESTRLMRHVLEREERILLSDPARLAPEEWFMDRTGRHVYFTAEEGGARHLFRTGASGGKARRIVAGGTVRDVRTGPDGHLFFLRGSLEQPAELERTDEDGNHDRALTAFNAALLEDTRLGSTRRQRFEGPDGGVLEAHLALPPGFDPARRWPILLLLHGGPHVAWLDRFYRRWNLLAFASPGYVVVAPNHRGSTGYGEAFAGTLVGDPLAPAAADVLAIADQLATLPWVDADRMALVGGSYGGYLAHWLVTRDHRFRTAVVHAGIFDLMVQAGSDFPWGRERTYGARPWEDPERYRALSPSSYAGAIRTPLLLLHGERDTRVPPVHSTMAHNILTARGVPSRLVLFPEDGHRIDRRSAAQRWWTELFTWLGRHVGPGPAAD